MTDTSGKIKSRRRIIGIIRRLKARRKKIVFTNGCFDILHPGHIKVFEKSRSLGDVLVAGINTDSSVRRLKGNSRPVMDEKSRARLVAALEAVDYVVLFNEDTPSELIKSIRPDILVKGGDYLRDDIAGREYAGRVVRIALEKGFSTTEIIKKIIKKCRPATILKK